MSRFFEATKLLSILRCKLLFVRAAFGNVVEKRKEGSSHVCASIQLSSLPVKTCDGPFWASQARCRIAADDFSPKGLPKAGLEDILSSCV